jgi:two-component system NtrC family response regulator
METLPEYPWPGNVRELIHTMERALAAARCEPTLFAKHLPDEIRIYLARNSLEKSRAKGSKSEDTCLNGNSLKLKDYRE